jgi:hypothetical protein
MDLEPATQPPPSKVRRSAGFIAAAAAWAAWAWLGSLIVPVPAGALAFFGILVLSLLCFSLVGPLSAFHISSAANGIGIIVGAIVAIRFMHTQLLPLLTGVLVLLFGIYPALLAFRLVSGDRS